MVLEYKYETFDSNIPNSFTYNTKLSNTYTMSKPFSALIKADGIPGNTVYSKYRLEGRWENPETGIFERWVFNINADVAVPTFHSEGADATPQKWSLNGTYDNNTQLTGFDRFSGSIGECRIYIRTDKGITVKGVIVGGPPEGTSFVGAGTWTKS